MKKFDGRIIKLIGWYAGYSFGKYTDLSYKPSEDFLEEMDNSKSSIVEYMEGYMEGFKAGVADACRGE